MEIFIFLGLFGVILLLGFIGNIKNAFKERDELSNKLSESNNKIFNANKLLEQNTSEIEIVKKENTKLEINVLQLKETIKNNDYEFSLIKNKYEQLKNEYNKIKDKEISHEKWKIEQDKIITNNLSLIETNLEDRASANKWISPMLADIKMILFKSSLTVDDFIKGIRDDYSLIKIERLKHKIKTLYEENTVLKYQIEYIKTLIPEVDDIVEYDEYYNSNDDSPSNYLSKEEYEKLSDTEKNIRALEYYKKRKKRNWEIGRDFERFIGYLYEKEGFNVEYYGIEKKLNDLGRDLIIKNKELTMIIQCKYWSKNKIIHEKHIAQLFGTVTKYKIDNPNEKNVIGLFVSHTTLSDEAKNFAKALNIHLKENIEMGEYPLIICNVGRDKNGNKSFIYHLPMDQQYDRIIVNKSEGDCYAFTIEKAEEKGFRRAWKWHG